MFTQEEITVMKTAASMMENDLSIEDVVDVTPVINHRNTIQVVYSIDSAVSILSASYLKKLVVMAPHDSIGSLSHLVDFVEVASFRGNEKRDKFIWLDLSPRLINGGNGEQGTHYAVCSDGSGDWWQSAFAEKIEAYGFDNGFITQRMSATSEPCDKDHRVFLGQLLNAVSAFSYAAPEFNIPEPMDLIHTLSTQQNELAMFNSVSCKTKQLLTTFADICDALFYLGHQAPANLKVQDDDKTLVELVREGDFTASFYYQEYLAIRKTISAQATRQYVTVRASSLDEVNRSVEVIVTRIPNFFWVARRMISINDRYCHNSRLTARGVHVTTDLPEGSTPVVQRLEILNEA